MANGRSYGALVTCVKAAGADVPVTGHGGPVVDGDVAVAGRVRGEAGIARDGHALLGQDTCGADVDGVAAQEDVPSRCGGARVRRLSARVDRSGRRHRDAPAEEG